MFRTLKLATQFCTAKIIDIPHDATFKGVLTICPTPIGNLQDWSPRQHKALFEADVIACEDTRTTGFLVKLIRQRNLQLTQTPTDPKECDLDDDDFTMQDMMFKSAKELQTELPELNKEFINEKDFKFFKQKRIDEMNQRIKDQKQKQNEHLHEQDPLNFMGKEEQGEESAEDFEIYGITAPFMAYLKNKIRVAKQRKGRGVLISCNKFNEERRINRLIAMLKMGLNITLVCDAGTPTISDPGYIFVGKCIDRNITIDSVPGASSVVVALSMCGFPADQFQFMGFSSKTLNDREEKLIHCKKAGQTTVLFESALRLNQLLLSIEKVYGEHQQVWIGFELTKMFEKKLRGRCRDLYEDLTNPKVLKASHLKGEVTVIIAPYTAQYNDDLKAQQVTQQNEDNDDVEPNDKEDGGLLIRKVEALQFAQILGDKINISDREFAELLMQSLRISKSKATKLVITVRHGKQNELNKKKIREQLGINLKEKWF